MAELEIIWWNQPEKEFRKYMYKRYKCKETGEMITLGRFLKLSSRKSRIYYLLPNILREAKYLSKKVGYTKKVKEFDVLESVIIETINHEVLHHAVAEIYGKHPEEIVQKLNGEVEW